jgi:hypothetical protein
MCSLQTILDNIELQVLTDPLNYSEIEIQSGYTSDLLSCVMTGAKADGVWVTLISNINIVAVASLRKFPPSSSQKCSAQIPPPLPARIGRLCALSTPVSSYQIVGRLWELGIKIKTQTNEKPQGRTPYPHSALSLCHAGNAAPLHCRTRLEPTPT